MPHTDPKDSQLKLAKKTFNDVFGGGADDFQSDVNGLAPEFGDFILRSEFADIYNRPGLSLMMRELVIIASCATLGTIGHSAVRMHTEAALRAGATKSNIVEVLVQVSMAAGLPTALGALGEVQQVFRTLQGENR